MNRTKINLRILVIAFAVLLGLIPSILANTLENIDVSRDGDSVVVTITTTEPAQYNAFIINSKPERIVIDLDKVKNSISKIEFTQLPCKSIRAIRTSQFKLAPELQSRVVLSIRRPIEYRHYQDGRSIIVKLPAIADEAQFSEWHAIGENSNVELAPAAPAPKPIEQPKKAEVKPQEPAKAMAEAPKVQETPKAEPVEPVQPEVKKDEPVEVKNPVIVEEPAKKEEAPPAVAEAVPTKSEDAQVAVDQPNDPEDLPAVDPDELAQLGQGVDIASTDKRKTIDYDSHDTRDPFASLVGSGVGKKMGGLPSLENLKLVGILEDIDINRALLEDTDGNGYMLKPNDKVRGGYLMSVTGNSAIFQVTEYGWTRTVALELDIPEVK